MAGNKDVKRGIVLYIDGKEVKNNAKQIQAEMRKVKKEIDGCTLGSKEYITATKRYRELNAILNEHKAQLRDVKKEHFSFINTVNGLWQKWQLAIGGFLAAFAGVSLALSKFRKEMNATEESSANLKALTGLDDNSIQWLQEQAETLATTMDKTGLRVQKSAKDILEAYMLVGSAKPELLQDKEALNAVTIEALRLAEAAKMDLKAAVDGVTLSLNQYGESADKASRYVNVLAAGSKFGAANVENQTAAIIKAGVAASVAKVPIESLVGSIETLAEKGIKGEVAGTGLKTFFLKLEGMADDVRPSIVGLETALENLRKKNLSTAETQKLFGLEAYTVAQAMISGAEKVHDYTAAVTDTNVAIEQAAINSDTANAKLAQMKNEFTQQGIILVKELNPAITKFVSLGMNSTRMLVSVVRFLTEYRVTMIATSAAIAAYIMWNNRKVIAEKLSALWSDNLKKSMTGLFQTIKSNPWGLALIAITAVTAAIIDHNRKLANQEERLSKIAKLEKDAKTQADEQRATIKYLTSVINDNNASLDRRRKALDKLKEIVPEYHAELDAEGRLIKNNTTALNDYLAKLETKIKMDAYENAMVDAIKRKQKAIADIAKAEEKTQGDIRAKVNGSTSPGSWLDSLLNLPSNGDEEMRKKADAARRYANAMDDIAEITKQMAALDAELASLGDSASTGGSNAGSGTGAGTVTTKASDRVKKETEAIELEYKKQLAMLKREYATGIKDRQQYNDEMSQLEIDRINKLLNVAGLEPSAVADLQNRLIDFSVKAREQLQNLDLDVPGTKEEDKIYNEYLNKMKKLEDKQKESIATLRRNLELRNITQVQFDEKKSSLDAKFTQEQENLWNEYVQQLINAQTELTEGTEEQMNKLEALMQKAGVDIQNLVEDVGTAIGQGLANSLAGEEDALKNALKSLLNTLLSAIEKMVIAAEVESSLLTVSGLGTAKGLANLAKLAGIVVAFEALKAGVNSFAVGGFTGVGGIYEPAGVVHRNEFVANSAAVSNPNIRPILETIDFAQRSGTVSQLTKEELTSSSSSLASSAKDEEMRKLIAQCTAAMERVDERFSSPIVAETYATGRHGTMEAEKQIRQMTYNARRHA